MLGDPDGHHGQLLDLVAGRLAYRDPLVLAERVPAAARRRPVLDDLIDGPSGQQRPSLALMARLATGLAARRILATTRRTARRIGTGRLGGVARRALGLTLKPRDPLILLRHALFQPRDLLIHPQQDRNDRLAALVVDRLGICPLHTTGFAANPLCPADQLNAYGFSSFMGGVAGGLGSGSTTREYQVVAPHEVYRTKVLLRLVVADDNEVFRTSALTSTSSCPGIPPAEGPHPQSPSPRR